MTSLIPQAPADLSKVTDLATALKSVTSQKPVSAPEKPAEPHNVVVVPTATVEAISKLNELLASTELPSEPVRLTPAQLVSLHELADAAKKVKSATEDAVSAVKDAVFSHLDLGLEAANDSEDLPWDAENSHYLVKGEQSIPGTKKRFTRELREGSPTITAASLKESWYKGDISRDMYYKLTTKPDVPRVLNEEALLDELKVNPALAEKIAPLIERGKVTSAFYIR